MTIDQEVKARFINRTIRTAQNPARKEWLKRKTLQRHQRWVRSKVIDLIKSRLQLPLPILL